MKTEIKFIFFLGTVSAFVLQNTFLGIRNGVKDLYLPRRDTSRNCIEKTTTPISKSEKDVDSIWQTITNPAIIPVQREKFTIRPEVITFNAENTLIEPTQSIGRWLREILNTVCDMRIRLPRPALFSTAFFKAYNDMSILHPCFGATTGLTSEQWWHAVILTTFKTTENQNQVEEDELEALMPDVMNIFYNEVFGTKIGWRVKEDVVYTLKKLKEWRDIGAGPKIGIVSNFDERLPIILKDLELAEYFDFVLTSQQCQKELPGRDIFDEALKRARSSNPLAAFHIGHSVDTDVIGAVSAGWTGLRYHEWFDEDFPDWRAIDTPETTHEGAKQRAELLNWGRRDTERNLDWIEMWGLDDVLTLFGFPEDVNKPVPTTYVRGLED